MSATVERKSHWLRNLIVGIGIGFAVLAGLLVVSAREARFAARASSTNCRLKALGLAVHNYLDEQKELPPGATLGRNDSALYGWTVPLLPFLDEKALYESIELRQAWDAPFNQAAFKTPVKGLQSPLIQETESGGWPVSHFAGNARVLQHGSSVTLKGISDGLSNVILLGMAAGNYVPWGSPDNLRDPAAGVNAGPDSFGYPGRDWAFFLMGDGSVRTFRKPVDPKLLKGLATPDDGEPVPCGF
jgi:hypothetical protein